MPIRGVRKPNQDPRRLLKLLGKLGLLLISPSLPQLIELGLQHRHLISELGAHPLEILGESTQFGGVYDSFCHAARIGGGGVPPTDAEGTFTEKRAYTSALQLGQNRGVAPASPFDPEQTVSDTATTERPNKVSISDAGPARKKISIQVPAETVSEKLRESMDTFMVEAQLPGFRKGHAPKGLIQKKFGQAMKDETKKQLVAAAYQDAIKDSKLQIVGEPFSETLDAVEIKDGQPLDFEIEVEVQPEFELPSLEAIPVRKPQIEVSDAMVKEEFEKIRINEGRLESRESSEPGDYLTGRGRMVGSDGKEFYDINGAVVQKPGADKGGKGMVLGIMVEDFDRQLGSPKPGDTVTIKAKGPDQHEIEGIRNNDLTITFAVERIDRIIAASAEDLVKQFGLENEAAMLDAIRSRMSQRVMIQQQTTMRQQIAQYILDKTEVSLPERMTAQQAMRTLQRQRLEMMYRGVEPAEIEERMAQLRAASGQMAKQELKLFFILNRIAEDMKIQVTEGEINGRIAQMAMERNVRPETLRQDLIQRNQVYGIFQQIREHKTFDALLAKATITEMALDEFNKLAEAENKARATK